MSRDTPDEPRKDLPQVGKRPSSPLMLAVTGVVWIVCGVIALTELHASWKFIPAIFFIGVGLLWVRGAAATAARHERGSGTQGR
ncbi:MAG: hypothetical protein ACLPVY_02580 [Acidimicrobiia bacterium]